MILYFDYRSFLIKITPVLKTLSAGNSNELLKLAKKIEVDNSNVWKILNFYGISRKKDSFQITNYDGIDDRSVFWLVLVMSDYCLIIDNPLDTGSIGDILNLIGIEEEFQLMLAIGRPFSTIFSTHEQIMSNISLDYTIASALNHYPAGWLSIEDIKAIKAKLSMHQDRITHPALVRFEAMLDTAIQSERGLILGVAI